MSFATNPQNAVKATLAALSELRDAESTARLRGVPMEVLRG